MARPPLTLEKARVINTAISTLIWWVMLYLTGVFAAGGSGVTHVPPARMATATLIMYLFLPFFATHSVLLSGLKRVMHGKIVLPDDSVDVGASASNAWRTAAKNALIYGAAPALAGFVLASGSTAELSARQFAVRLATPGALLAGVVVFIVAGRPLREATRVPRGKPRFGGDPKPYLWNHFMLPQGFINLVLNVALAFVLPVAVGKTEVSAMDVVIDTAIASAILTLIIAGAARSQAQTEAEWGIAPAAAGVARSRLAAFSIPLLGALCLTVVLGIGLRVAAVQSIDVSTWAVLRGIFFGAYAAWVAKSSAQATIHRVLAPSQQPLPLQDQTA